MVIVQNNVMFKTVTVVLLCIYLMQHADLGPPLAGLELVPFSLPKISIHMYELKQTDRIGHLKLNSKTCVKERK